jgi:predicted RNA-binding Zn-ribbon protein involved in translation (DUF1610 family)
MIWWIIGAALVVIVFVNANRGEPCPKCGGHMLHMVGQDSGATAEALFKCADCGFRQHRGGWGSELHYDRASRAAHEKVWAESDRKRNRHRR